MIPVALWLLLLSFFHAPVASDLSLSTLRSSTTLPTAVAAAQQPLPSTFLPLCGNGRLDTLADYRALANQSSAALRPNLIAYATEVCDDGNRIDNDGCSADCMLRDLWTSPCKLRVDGSVGKVEAVLPFTDESMLVSNFNSFVLVNSLPRPDDRILNATTVFSKDYRVTDLIRTRSNAIVAYSSSKQQLYSIDVGKKTSTLMLDLSSILQIGRSDPAYQYASGSDLLVLRDGHAIVLVSLATLTVRGKCAAVQSLDQAVYIDDPNGEDVLTIRTPTGTVRVQPAAAPLGVQCTEANSVWGSEAVGDIWRDSFRSILDTTGQSRTLAYNMSTFLANGNNTGSVFRGQSVYLPLGLWVESSSSFLRDLVNAPLKVSSAWVGHPALFGAYSSVPVCASSGLCALDVSSDYDLVTGFSGRGTLTWQTRLQSVLKQVVTGIADFTALYTASAYAVLWGAWTADVSQNGMGHRIRDFAVHPVTGNIWAISSDGWLYEISKSGVTVPVRDGTGRCMPSGVAVCEPCMWAEAGGVCKPCIQNATTSWAASMQCQSCGKQDVRIEFTASKRFDLPSCAQGATWSSNDSGLNPLDVGFYTKTPVQCMRALAEVLPGSPVVTKPSVVIGLQVDTGGSSLDVLLILGSFIGGIAGLGLIVGFVRCYCYSNNSSRPVYTGPGNAPFPGPEIPRIVFRSVLSERFGDLKCP